MEKVQPRAVELERNGDGLSGGLDFKELGQIEEDGTEKEPGNVVFEIVHGDEPGLWIKTLCTYTYCAAHIGIVCITRLYR